MIKEFYLAWEKNKDTLKEYFRTHEKNNYDSYGELVELLFNLVINPEMDYKFNTDDMVELDNGGYQGTLIFILHRDTYQPDVTDYVYTNTSYGSCGYCDVLESIYYSNNETSPTDDQVDSYMKLCLYLLQKCVFMIDPK